MNAATSQVAVLPGEPASLEDVLSAVVAGSAASEQLLLLFLGHRAGLGDPILYGTPW